MSGKLYGLTDACSLTSYIVVLALLAHVKLLLNNNSSVAALSCLGCHDVISPKLCNTTIECRAGEICFTELVSNHTYRLGCINSNDCKVSQDPIFVGRRKRIIDLPTYCGLCCDGLSNCNRNLCDSRLQYDRNVYELVQPPLRTDACSDLTPVSCSLLVIEEPSICVSSGIKHYACRKSCGTCNKNSQHLSDCFYNSQKYEGVYTTTQSGKPCVPWAKFTSNVTSLLSKLPDKSLSSAANKCRDPDGKGHPWCYIDPNMDWEYCAVPYCQECYYPNDTTLYRGYVAVTSDGQDCEPWTSSSGIPLNQAAFPDGSAEAARNYCRDPFNFAGKLLCYTQEGFKECSIPKCPFECRDDPNTDCSLISKYVCANEYTSLTLCPKTCGKCYFGLLPPRIISPPTGSCEDKPDANCFVLGNFICSDPKGSRELCPKTCKVCWCG